MSDDIQPTHRIHWRAASDAKVSGRTFGRLDHDGRVKQAGFCWDGGLIPTGCHFGPRRVRLEGEFDYAPRFSYEQPSPAYAGHTTALAVLEWTLRMLYDMRGPGADSFHPEIHSRNARIEVRVTELDRAEA